MPAILEIRSSYRLLQRFATDELSQVAGLTTGPARQPLVGQQDHPPLHVAAAVREGDLGAGAQRLEHHLLVEIRAVYLRPVTADAGRGPDQGWSQHGEQGS